MADARVEYLIEILKAGDGARQAAADLKSIEGASVQSNTALTTLSSSWRTMLGLFAATAAIRESVGAFLQQSSALSRLKEISGATARQHPSPAWLCTSRWLAWRHSAAEAEH